MRALLIVDVQNDFCPGGALGVSGGDKIVPVINGLLERFEIVIASKDWHPDQSIHFGKWPPHCVHGTFGAEFHPDLASTRIDKIFLKGTEGKDDGYSAFEATNMDLAAYLQARGVAELYIVGLATDYCVRATALDAMKRGFTTFVVTDAVAAVDVSRGDGEAALKEIREAGAALIDSAHVE